MESQLLVARRVNDNLMKQNCILERKCAANEQYSRREYLDILEISEIISNNNSKETVFKIFDETGVTVNSRDVEACHRLNQKANPKEVIMELSKRKDVARVKKLKCVKLHYHVTVKFTYMKGYVNTMSICGGNVNC